MSKVLFITCSLRNKSNSDILASKAMQGAMEAGNDVECISLKDKQIAFCKGCMACQKTQRCVIADDARMIADKVKEADSVVFVTPIYYYEMSGQMKTVLDRLNPLYAADYKFRNIYMISCAAEDESFVPQKARSGLLGWIDCFEKAQLKDTLFCGGINDPAEAEKHQDALDKAYAFGKSIV